MSNTTKIQYDQLDDFTKAYIIAALWSSNEDNGDPLDANYDGTHIHEDSLQSIYEDCKKFQHENACLWDDKESGSGEWNIDQQAGHDFWLTRNGHGVGFWDRPKIYGEDDKDELTDACKEYGQVNASVEKKIIYFE